MGNCATCEENKDFDTNMEVNMSKKERIQELANS